MKRFWMEKRVWPETEPIELYGPAVQRPTDPVYAVNGADISSRELLEDSLVDDYRYRSERVELAFADETERAFVEWREGLE